MTINIVKKYLYSVRWPKSVNENYSHPYYHYFLNWLVLIWTYFFLLITKKEHMLDNMFSFGLFTVYQYKIYMLDWH